MDRKAGVPQRTARVEVRSMAATLVPDLAKYPHAWPMTWNLVEVWEAAAAARGRAGALAALDARAGDDGGGGAGGGAEIHPPMADRGDAPGAQERLQGGGPSLGDLGRTGEGGDGEGGGGGADRVVARPGARGPRGAGVGVLEADEVEVLVRHFGKGKAIEAAELTIGQAVLWIGRLGGHLNRKGDGMPGVRTLWRGLHDLTLLVAGFRAAKELRE